MIQRRIFLKSGLSAVSLVAAPHLAAQAGERVVIVGGGFGGATAARYLRRFNPALQITLVEPAGEFVMCPMSNRVIHGGLQLRDITRPYGRLVTGNGLRWVRARADGIDVAAREARAGAERIPYDRLIVAPGVDYAYEGADSSAAGPRAACLESG